MRYGLLALALWCMGCGNPSLPPVRPQKTDDSVDAKEQARIIAGQKCRYAGYKDVGRDDWGAQQFDCEHGKYTLELGQSHRFEREFFSLKPEEEIVLRYSDELLMKPVYVGSATPQDANPAYYLAPVR